MTDLVKLYNPANAASLTPEQIEGLQKLDSAQIKELANAYPNMTMQRAYLLIVDKTLPPHKQLARMSTFENLWNLREKNAQRNFVAYNFRGNYKPKTVTPQRPKKTEVLDLSDVELMELPGFKKSGATLTLDEVETPKVKITKIKKVPVEKKLITISELKKRDAEETEIKKVPVKKTAPKKTKLK